MILVELSWQDQFGTQHTCPAKLEDTSVSGACVRLTSPVGIGSMIRVNSYRERFSGTTRYCRAEGRDFIVGIQKDKSVDQFAAFVLSAPRAAVPLRNTPSVNVRPVAGLGVPLKTQRPATEPPQKLAQKTHRDPSVTAAAPTGAETAPPATAPAKPRAVPSLAVMPGGDAHKQLEHAAAIGAAAGPYFATYDTSANYDNLDAHRGDSSHPRAPQFGRKKEGTIMPSKWSDLAPWRQKEAPAQDAAPTRSQASVTPANRSLEVAARGDKPKPVAAAPTPAPTELATSADAVAPARPQGDLLSMDDIYRAAGILTPRLGYSITKVADMLSSDHLRGLSDEMKRASVLMALDAAGISVEEVLRDAAFRTSAINSYESDQWQQFEEYWAAKAEENAHIQAEIERVTAQYQERIKRNLDEVAREKVIFAGWQTRKQQEAQRIGEAAGICSKPSLDESREASPRSYAAKPA